MNQSVFSTVRCTIRVTVWGSCVCFLVGTLLSLTFAQKPLDYRVGWGWHASHGLLAVLLGAGPLALIGAWLDGRRHPGRFQLVLVLLLICLVVVETALCLAAISFGVLQSGHA